MQVHRQWPAIVEAVDPKAALGEHLALLCASDEDRAILARLLALVEHIEADDKLEVTVRVPAYDDTYVVEFAAPAKGFNTALPPSVQEIARWHANVSWDTHGAGIYGFYVFEDHLDIAGGWETGYLEEAADDNATFLAELEAAGLGADDVKGAMDYGQNWLVWHPVRRNALGEPALYFVSHEDCVAVPVTEADGMPFGSVLLRVMAESLLDEDHFEATSN